MLIAGALDDVGYGQRGVDPAFEIEPSPDSSGVTLHIPYSHPDGTPRRMSIIPTSTPGQSRFGI